MRHPDFIRIHKEFCAYYCKGIMEKCPKGDYEYYQWLKALNLDETLAYHQASESFQWAKNNIRFWKEDADNKYYKVLVAFPLKSMNGNVYREEDLINATKSLVGVHPSLNHKDEYWFSPDNPHNKWGTLTVVGAEYEDGAAEAALQVPKSAICPICNGDHMTELIDNKRIVNVSLEGGCKNEWNSQGNCEGFTFNEKGFTLLTTDVLPGIPLARIFPMESYLPFLRSSRHKRIKIIGIGETTMKESKVQEPCRWSQQGFSSGEDCVAQMTGKVDDPQAFCYGPAEKKKEQTEPPTFNEQPEQPTESPKCPEGQHWSGELQDCVDDNPQPEHTPQLPEGTEVEVGTQAAPDTSKQVQIQGETLSRKLEVSSALVQSQQDRAKVKSKEAELLQWQTAYKQEHEKRLKLEGQLENFEKYEKFAGESQKRISELEAALKLVETSRDNYKKQYEDLQTEHGKTVEKYRKSLEANLALEKKLNETNEQYLEVAKDNEQKEQALLKSKNLAGKIRVIGLEHTKSPKQ